jgi:hypothetical protein
VEVALSGYGCPGAVRAASSAVPVADGDRIDLQRGAGLVEWYANGPAGLEQGFTLARAPACGSAAGTIVIELTLRGLGAELTPNGDAILLRRGDGTAVLRYGALAAHDAAGRPLPARLALAGDRVTLRVDAPGAVYPVTVDPLVTTEEAKLLASDGAKDDELGNAVALSGDTAIVGASSKAGAAGPHVGAAYVYVRSGTTWTQQARLVAADGAPEDFFGCSVALSGDTAVIGAYNVSGPAGGHQGAAYVFGRSGATWTQQQQLLAADAAPNDLFGFAVAVAGDQALIGAHAKDGPGGYQQGAAYVFGRSGAAWSQQQKLLAADGAADDELGYAVALSGRTAILGANGRPGPAGSQQGAAYVFTSASTGWTQQAVLIANDGASGDQLGSAVAVDVDTAVVGADSADGRQGAAYVFTRAGASWSQQGKLAASDGATADRFADSVAVAGDLALAGASYKTGPAGQYQGAAYAFVRCGGAWSEQAKLEASDGAAGDRFGSAVALAGDVALVGAYLRYSQPGTAGEYQGAAYTFLLKHPNGDACATPAECASGIKADGVCCDRACTGQCEACDVAGSAGTCVTVVGPPHAGRPGCGGSGPCQGACDGTSTVACVFPGAATFCAPGSCTDGVETAPAVCDGAGACAVAATRSCGDYACGPLACLTSCTTDADCAPGRVCANGVCTVPPDGGLHLDGGVDGPGDAGGDAAGDGGETADAGGAGDGRHDGAHGGGLRGRGCECRAAGAGAAGADGAALIILGLGLTARPRRRRR